MDKIKVPVLEIVTSEPCEKCGSTAWIVDGDGFGKHWLLCMTAKGAPCCVECKPLPDDMEVIEDERTRSNG